MVDVRDKVLRLLLKFMSVTTGNSMTAQREACDRYFLLFQEFVVHLIFHFYPPSAVFILSAAIFTPCLKRTECGIVAWCREEGEVCYSHSSRVCSSAVYLCHLKLAFAHLTAAQQSGFFIAGISKHTAQTARCAEVTASADMLLRSWHWHMASLW